MSIIKDPFYSKCLTVNGLRLPLRADGGVSESVSSVKVSSASFILASWILLPLFRSDLAVFQVKHLSISDLRQKRAISINNNFR